MKCFFYSVPIFCQASYFSPVSAALYKCSRLSSEAYVHGFFFPPFFPRRYFSVCGIAIGTVVGIARAAQQSTDGSWFQATMNKFMQWPISSTDLDSEAFCFARQSACPPLSHSQCVPLPVPVQDSSPTPPRPLPPVTLIKRILFSSLLQ